MTGKYLPFCRRGKEGVRIGTVCEQGTRESQQDAFCIAGEECSEQGVLAVVADGMGGLTNSELVSRAIVTAMQEAYAPGGEIVKTEEMPSGRESKTAQFCAAQPSGGITAARQLQLLFQRALKQVDALMEGSTAKSGSTAVACIVKDKKLSWLAVGDSRIYLWRGGGLLQLNQDHNFAGDLTMLAIRGEITFEEAERDPRRESLTSYIGAGFPYKMEFNREVVVLLPKDKVLLVSDGIYRTLSQAEMADILRLPADRAAKKLRAAVLKKALPQQDNFTAVVLEIL